MASSGVCMGIIATGANSCGIGREHVDRHLIVGTGGGPAQVILSNAVECEPKARIDQREVDAQLRQSFVQQSWQQRSGLVEGLAGDAPPVASPGAIVLALRPGGAVPRVSALPERSHPVDRLSAAHFTQVLEKDRHRFQPVAVAVDHGVFRPACISAARLLTVTAPLSRAKFEA